MGEVRAGPTEAALYNGMYSGPWAPRAREPPGRPKTHRFGETRPTDRPTTDRPRTDRPTCRPTGLPTDFSLAPSARLPGHACYTRACVLHRHAKLNFSVAQPPPFGGGRRGGSRLKKGKLVLRGCDGAGLCPYGVREQTATGSASKTSLGPPDLLTMDGGRVHESPSGKSPVASGKSPGAAWK